LIFHEKFVSAVNYSCETVEQDYCVDRRRNLSKLPTLGIWRCGIKWINPLTTHSTPALVKCRAEIYYTKPTSLNQAIDGSVCAFNE